ncbi:hypothetical protein F140042L4_05780 [Coprococcus phoceensis]
MIGIDRLQKWEERVRKTNEDFKYYSSETAQHRKWNLSDGVGKELECPWI